MATQRPVHSGVGTQRLAGSLHTGRLGVAGWFEHRDAHQKSEATAVAVRILAGIPHGGHLESQAVESWLNLVIPDHVTVTWRELYGYQTSTARNLLVEECLRDGYDRLWFIDSDCVIPANTLDLLLDVNQPMVSGCYVKKQDQRAYELYDWVNDHFVPWRELPTQPQPVAGAGMGCFIMDVQHCVSWPRPWFVNTEHEPQGLTEDLNFARLCARHHTNIWMHPGVQIQHVGRKLWQ